VANADNDFYSSIEKFIPKSQESQASPEPAVQQISQAVGLTPIPTILFFQGSQEGRQYAAPIVIFLLL
jgi:hypothetical protein